MYTLLYIFIDMYTLLYLGCAGSLLLLLGFLQLQSMGSRHMGFSGCGTGARYLWLEGLVALQHVESSQRRDRTCVPALAGGFLPTMPPEKSCAFWGTAKMFSTVVAQFTFLPPTNKDSSFSTSSLTLGSICLFYFNHSGGYEVVVSYGFGLYFFDD